MTPSDQSGLALVQKYFPNLTTKQIDQFSKLGESYRDWNSKINVVSRKDIDGLYLHHVLHSLGIAKVMPFADGSKILDIGTGGGFPGIPLAILFPNVHFSLVDSIGKKIIVVKAVAEELGLTNVEATHARAEQIRGPFDFVVSRAVTRLATFIPYTYNKFSQKQLNPFPNGILYLKGGDLSDEIKEVRQDKEVILLDKYFDEEFFMTKAVVYIRMA
ncbi:MAG: 16S rRNA (guanine(527)-N(7))-methyltransferase RsmG [Cryomorphaceae bacterium]|nr:16S rRNA (guanine(527)-N(7))-methyltransferase RsmG [Cryomorphaceae bacterium]